MAWPELNLAHRTQAGHGGAAGGSVAIGLGLGLVAGSLAVFALGEIKYVVFLLALTLLGSFFALSGNFRLACLYAALLAAPLRLGKPFLISPHMGGAGAFWIDGVDIFLLLLIRFQIADRMTGRTSGWVFPKLLWLWVALIGLGVLSIAQAPYRMVAAHEVVRMLKLLVLMLVLINEVVRQKQFVHAMTALLLGVALNSGLAIAQYATGLQFGLDFLGEGGQEGIESVGSVTLLSREFVFRPGGLMGAGNLFAAYLALLLPVAVALLLAPLRLSVRLLAGGVFLLGLPALVFTLSRSGWLSFGASFLLALLLGIWHPVSRRRFMAMRVLIIAITVIAGLALSPLILKRLQGSDPNALEVRYEWLRTARAIVLDKPVLGVGLNKYVFLQLPYGKDKTADEMTGRYGKYWPVVHSTWAVTWAEQGSIGMLLFVGLHLAVLRVGLGNLKLRDPLLHAMGVGLLAGFLAIMIDGVGSFFLRNDQHARVFWIVTALILALRQWRRSHEPGSPLAAAAMPLTPPVQPTATRWLPTGPAAPRGRWASLGSGAGSGTDVGSGARQR